MTSQTIERPREVGKRAMLAVADLRPNPANRKVAHDEDVKALARSVKEVGLLHPIIVRPHPEEEGRYRIIAGERRWRALRKLGAVSAPCVVVNGAAEGPSEAEIIGVVENHLRRDPTVIEEAAAVRALLASGLEPEAIARSLGRSRAWVSRRSSLSDLAPAWLAEIEKPESRISAWPASHLELIARFPAAVQEEILTERGRYWRSAPVPTLEELREATGEFLSALSAAPWKLGDDTLVPESGACSACGKRASCAPDLFEEELLESGKASRGDRCLDTACWRMKAVAHLGRRLVEARAEHENLVTLDLAEACEPGPEIEPHGLPVLYAHQVTACRKSDKGAIPALVIGGPGLGRVKWVRLPKEKAKGRNGTAAGSSKDSAARPVEKTLAERREPYDRRQRQHVIEAVKARIEKLAKAASAEKALELEGGAMLAGRGLAAKAIVLLGVLLGESGWKLNILGAPLKVPRDLSWDDLSAFQNPSLGQGETREALLALAWQLQRLCLLTIHARLTLASGTNRNEREYEEAEQLCGMLAIDIAALRAEAATAVPYAKAWKDDVEDGWAKRADVPAHCGSSGTARSD